MDTKPLSFDEISNLPENLSCVDCRRENWSDFIHEKKSRFFQRSKKESTAIDYENKRATEYVSLKLGIFLCKDCAEIHQKFDNDISSPIPLENAKLIAIEESQELNILRGTNNVKFNKIYEPCIPIYYIKPDHTYLQQSLAIFRERFIIEKYLNNAFTTACKDDYILRMPEMMHEMEVMNIRGNKISNKMFIVHHHYWISTYESPSSGSPDNTIEIPHVKKCGPIFVPVNKDEENTNFLEIVYSKREKEKSMIFLAPNLEKLESMIESIRRAMYFYKNEGNAPKTFTVPQIDRIANLMIQNSMCKGFLEKKSTTRNVWNKRYFAIIGPTLYYFSKMNDTRPNGLITLQNTEVKKRPAKFTGKRYSFVLVCKTRTFIFAAESIEKQNDWIASLRNIQRESPLRRKCNFSEYLEIEEGKEDSDEDDN